MKFTTKTPKTRVYLCSSCAKLLKRGRRRYATASRETPDLYDVVCVGGGPAGLSLLTALRASPTTSHLKLALIESQDLTPARTWSLPQSTYSNRASSLTPSSLLFLDSIGATSYLSHDRLQPYHAMRVWDGLAPSSVINFHSLNPPTQTQPPAIAHMSENANLVRALLSRLSTLPPIPTFSPATLTSITLPPPPPPSSPNLNLSSWPLLTLSTSATLQTRLLIGADGPNSPVRTFASIPSRGWDYDRHAVVATLTLAPSDRPPSSRKTAYQRFLPTGPIALLPLPGPHATLVWSTLPSHASHLKSLSPADFCTLVDAAFRLHPVDISHLHTLPSNLHPEAAWREPHTPFSDADLPSRILDVQPHSIASFPLKMRHADRYVAERVALVGDAAHSIHPLAGQGLNLALADVKALVGAVERATLCGADIGLRASLEPFERERYVANGAMLGVVDKLHKLYGWEWGPLVGMRGLGLGVVEMLGGLKGWLMRRAGGGEGGGGGMMGL
ncbi:putative ubiquinone biosynthesis monooxygenase [Loxospora ochrophaea]|nr:putative ubiquinone biosynthesis monooxygenase [Loxospora ochrophaea]